MMHDPLRQTETAGDKSDSEIHRQAGERASKVLRLEFIYKRARGMAGTHTLLSCVYVCVCVERYNLVV